MPWGLARQLPGTLQEQLQQATNREVRQADEARKAHEEATARELRQAEDARKAQQAALERERRQLAEAHQVQEYARKQRQELYDLQQSDGSCHL